MLRALIILGECALGLLLVATAFVGELSVYSIAQGAAGAFMVGIRVGVAITRENEGRSWPTWW